MDAMRRIVYLEDRTDVAEFVLAALSSLGYETAYTQCAQKLDEELNAGPIEPGVEYLLDVENLTETNVRGVSGCDIAAKLMVLDPSAKITLGTGSDLQDLPLEIQLAVAQGKIKYLPKPFRLGNLRELYEN